MSTKLGEPGFYTRDGQRLEVDKLKPEDIVLAHVQERLSKVNRWCGETLHPWSVAAHSLLMLDEARQRGITDEAELRAILTHDFHEAFVVDVTRDIKQLPGMESYRALCDTVQSVINGKYGIEPQSGFASVEVLDRWAAQVEYNELIYPGRERRLCVPRTWWHDFTRLRQECDRLGIREVLG